MTRLQMTLAALWNVVRRLALGLLLIVAASAVLLVSDLGRRTARATRLPRLAILQHASTTVHDEAVRGMLEALTARGYVDGRTAVIQRFNAQGDIPTGTTIARQVTAGEFDYVITSSTPSMQAVANANRSGAVTHIFGIVADPFSAGIGLNRDNPADHPPHMTGQSIFLPVRETFERARQFFPGLTTVGVAWNPAESNSEAFTIRAREACRALGLTLIEANVDGASAAAEAVGSLIARGAQALWIGGDNAMIAATDTAIATARRGRIPVITIIPGKPDRGSLLDIGLDFHSAGYLTGQLTADVLGGADTSKIPVRDVQDEVPRQVIVNTLALKDLKDPWVVPNEVSARADVLVDEKGIHRRTPAPVRAAHAPLSKTWQVDLVQFNHTLDVEEAEAGVRDGLREAGLVEERDIRTRVRNANGDMVTVNGLIDAALGDGADLLITFSTPTLQAAMQRARQVPIVFTYLASAVAAGAGTSDTDHRPNVTGVYLIAAYEDMFAIIRQVLPRARRVGTLFVPAEVNSVYNRDELVKAAPAAGFEVVAVAANTAGEVSDAALALSSMKIDAICQIPGNLTASAFPSLAGAAGRARLPVFAFQSSQAKAGAVVAVARDYHDAGRASAQLAARVMRGESPAAIPLQPFRKTRTIVNLAAARSLGIAMPQPLVARADAVIGRD